MKRRMVLTTLFIAVLLLAAVGMSGLLSATGPSAEAGDDHRFEWNAGFGTPIAATASESPSGLPNSQKFAIEGSGTLSVDSDDGSAEDADGGGTFVHTTDTASGASMSGTWKAKKLLMFESYGPGDDTLPADWRGGRAMFLVHLKYDDGSKVRAILEIGCRLPGSPGVSGTIEGIRIMVDGGLNFNVAEDPRNTLFVDLADDDDGDDDDDDDDD